MSAVANGEREIGKLLPHLFHPDQCLGIRRTGPKTLLVFDRQYLAHRIELCVCLPNDCPVHYCARQSAPGFQVSLYGQHDLFCALDGLHDVCDRLDHGGRGQGCGRRLEWIHHSHARSGNVSEYCRFGLRYLCHVLCGQFYVLGPLAHVYEVSIQMNRRSSSFSNELLYIASFSIYSYPRVTSTSSTFTRSATFMTFHGVPRAIQRYPPISVSSNPKRTNQANTPQKLNCQPNKRTLMRLMKKPAWRFRGKSLNQSNTETHRQSRKTIIDLSVPDSSCSGLFPISFWSSSSQTLLL